MARKSNSLDQTARELSEAIDPNRTPPGDTTEQNPTPRPRVLKRTPADAPETPPASQTETSPEDPDASEFFSKHFPSRVVMSEESAAERRYNLEAKKIELQQQSPVARKHLGPLGAKIPGAEHVKVYKRLDDGKQGYAGEFSLRDLAQSQDLETFINRYVKPRYGAGEYSIVGVDAQGRHFDGGAVSILEPASLEPGTPPIGTNAFDLVQSLLEKSYQHMNMIKNQPAESPVKQLGEVLELQEKLVPKTTGLEAVVQAMQAQTNVMLQVLTQNRSKSADWLPVLTTAIPVAGAVVVKILERKPEVSTALPAMAPALNPLGEIESLAKIVALLKPDDSRIWNYVLAKEDKDKLGLKEVLELLQQNKVDSGSLQTRMGDMKEMMQFAQALREQSEGGGSGALVAIAEAVGAVFSNKNLGRSIADLVRQRNAQIELARRGQQIEQQKLAIQQIALQRSWTASNLVTATRTEPVAPPPEPALAQTPEPAPEPPTELTPELVPPPAVPVVPVPLDQIPQALKGLPDRINALVEAKDPAGLVEGSVLMIAYLHDVPEWQQVSEMLSGFIQTNDLAKFRMYFGSFLEGLERLGLIQSSLRLSTLQALEDNFDILVQKFTESADGGSADAEEEEDKEEKEVENEEAS